jgi:hypothetical protein
LEAWPSAELTTPSDNQQLRRGMLVKYINFRVSKSVFKKDFKDV